METEKRRAAKAPFFFFTLTEPPILQILSTPVRTEPLETGIGVTDES